MRVLICGDRHYNNPKMVTTIISGLKYLLHDDLIIIEGEAAGADTIAKNVARALNVKVEAFPADWATHGRAAGPIRNKQMLEMGRPDMVFAFHDDFENSKGTRNMVKQAVKRGTETYIVSRLMQGDVT